MNIIEKSSENLAEDGTVPQAEVKPLRIVMSPPELLPFEQVMRGEPSSATYIIQGYIAQGLAKRGYDLTFLSSLSPGYIICTTDPQRRTPASHTWTGSRWFGKASKGSWKVQRKLGIPYLNLFANYRLFDASMQCLPGNDLVYERNGIYKSGVAKACKRLGLPYVLYVEADEVLEHDIMGDPITGVLRWRAREAFQYNLNAADCIICVSKQLGTHLENNWNVPGEKIVVFPNVADVQRFRPDPAANKEIRASLGVGSSDPLVAFVGNFYEWHDVATLLNAFAQVLETSPDARLVLVGDGTRREAMMQIASDLGIDHALTFTGLVTHDDVPRYLSAADIAVVPYPPMETDLWLSPLKLFEYMASGTAVIASDIGQIRQIVQDGHNGLLVPPGDVSALAAALQQLISDPVLRSRLAQQAREDAVQKHSWDQYLTRLEQVFSAVIDGQSVDQL